MSQENVEIVLRTLDAMNDRELSRAPEFFDPDVEIDLSRNIFNPDVYRGYAGIERWASVVEDVWDDSHAKSQELIEAGDDVVVRVKITGKGRESGVETEMQIFNVWTLREGRILRLVGGFRNRAEALEAAGLSE